MKTVCVYCGSAPGRDPLYGRAAEALGRALAAAGIRLVYGGGSVGMMGILADAVLEAGGSVTGILPRFLFEREAGHNGIQDLMLVDSMHTRKRLMVEKSDAFVVLPGGWGTLDEAFEVLTWHRLGLHDRPVVIANIGGFWDPLLTMFDHLLDAGYIDRGMRALPIVVDSIDAVLPALRDAGPRDSEVASKKL